MKASPSFLIINEHGELFKDQNQIAISDSEEKNNLLRNLKLEKNSNLTTHNYDETYIVEAFDFPLQAYNVSNNQNQLVIQSQSNLFFKAEENSWSLDYLDRVCGLTSTGSPFVLTKKAQDKLFSICDEFDDDSFTLGGKKIETPPYFKELENISQAQFWNTLYQTEANPGWNLNQPAPAFKDMLPRLKLPKSRILVLGCGEGEDAALFAEAGHVVTAVDFSSEALERARNKYSHLKNLNFICENIFNLPHEWNHSFDVVVEHTLFCAIDPNKRNDLVTIWRRLLHEEGQLLSVFFTMFKRQGPPFGTSEFEIRQRLTNSFQFLFWGRLRNSLPQRLGRELFVLGKKK